MSFMHLEASTLTLLLKQFTDLHAIFTTSVAPEETSTSIFIRIIEISTSKFKTLFCNTTPCAITKWWARALPQTKTKSRANSETDKKKVTHWKSKVWCLTTRRIRTSTLITRIYILILIRCWIWRQKSWVYLQPLHLVEGKHWPLRVVLSVHANSELDYLLIILIFLRSHRNHLINTGLTLLINTRPQKSTGRRPHTSKRVGLWSWVILWSRVA